ncbi:acyl-CoA reductase, partial [Pantoea sp. SIMBA_072]
MDGLRMLEPAYRVWGGYGGEGVVIRSQDPVDFHPDGKIVNVVQVQDLQDAIRHVNIATQTVGVYPAQRKALL